MASPHIAVPAQAEQAPPVPAPMPGREPATAAALVQRTAALRDRVLRQTRAWEPFMQRQLGITGLAPGQRVLDAGAGAGGLQRLAAGMVGPTGRVTALDVDGVTGRQMLHELSGQGPDIFGFVEDDIEALEAVPGGPYDLVVACRVVFHLADPRNGLRRLWAQVRPGGALLVLDTDLTVTRSFPPQAALERGIRLVNDAFRRAGCDIEIGARMPVLFQEAGLGMPDGAESIGVISPAPAGAALLRQVLISLGPLIRTAGLADAAALRRLDEQLAQTKAAAGALRWADLVGTWKRKPGPWS